MEGPAVTELLAAHRAGDEKALDRAFVFVYDDLKRAASAQLRRNSTPTLNTTGLVNEAYLRLVESTRTAPTDRAHFLALAARAMRYIIIDYARRRSAAKRGGGVYHLRLDDDVEVAVESQAQQLLVLDEAIRSLSEIDERLVRIVECRFFTGMTESETAEALEMSLSTVKRDWKRAKAWLAEEMCNT